MQQKKQQNQIIQTMKENSNHPDLRILHRNDFGYIGKCPCCKEIQFCIGNVMSYMGEDEFLILFRSFERINDTLEDKIRLAPNGEKILLRSPVRNILFSFSPTQFKQVMDLFETGVVMLELEEVLGEN